MSLEITASDVRGEEFRWSLTGRLRVIDHGITLVNQDKFLEYADMGAFSVIAFDPASRLQDQDQLETIDELQIVPHALLGDGEMATLYACLDPDMSGTLAPLDNDTLVENQRDGASVLTTLPVSTLALDGIDDVTSVDWLLLDALNDNLTLLDHSVETMAETLLIHAHVPIMPTHHNQTSLGDICQWMTSHGFDCYQFNHVSHHSHFPADETLEKQQASQLASLEVLFTPGKKRLSMLSNERIRKLAFLMDAVYHVHDYSYNLLARVAPEQAKRYLIARGYISGYDAEPDTFTLTAEYCPAPWCTA